MNRVKKPITSGTTSILSSRINYLMFIVLFLLSSLANGQNTGTSDTVQYVNGVIRDAKTKEPIVAAQVSTLNQEAAATTNENGEFKIGVTSQLEVLQVKAYDYNLREVPVQGNDNLEIDLYPVFFKDMYPEIEEFTGKVRSSYSTASVAGTQEIGLPVYISLDEVIQSRMGGDARIVAHSGVTGAGSSIFIRGLNSINLNAQPLYVIDGVIWNDFSDFVSLHDGFLINPLADIDLNDIESISVIKDGTSIYGSKGGNGVILVKTKRGKDFATKIEVNAAGGMVEQPASLPVMNGDQLRIYITDLLGTMNVTQAEFEEMEFLQDDPNDLSYLTYHNSTNWDDVVYRQGRFQSYNVSVNGGDEKALYYFSMGYSGTRGVVKSTDLQRLNTRFNGDFFMSDKIKMGLNVGFTNVDRNLLDDGVNFYTSPTYLAMIKAEFLNPYMYTTSGTLTTDVEDSDVFGVGNPAAIIERALNTNKHYRLNMGILPEYQISPYLVFSSQFDFNLDKLKETYYSPIVGVADRLIEGFGISENVFRGQQMRNISIFDDTRLTFTPKIGNVHRLKAIAGWRFLNNSYESDYAEGHNSGSDQKRNLLYEEDFKTTNGVNNKINTISNYANLDYSYDNRYFLTASVSVDGSSRFGLETLGGIKLFGHMWGVFPSANLAWLISSESFMDGINFVDRLQVHAGFGLSGNDAIDPYAWSAYFNSIRYMDHANGLIIGNLANNEIQWETTGKINLGMDAILFNDRLSLSADVYQNRTRDLLTLKSLPELVGEGFFWSNGGEMSNTGYEISAVVKLLNLRSLKWEVGTRLGHYRNEILSLPDGQFTTSAYGAEILTSEGNPAGVFYGYKTDGIFTGEAEAEAANLKIIDPEGIEYYFSAGDVHFVDENPDNIIDEKDKQIIGDPNPDLYGNFNSKIALGKLTIDALFTFSYGNEIYNYLRAELESGNDFVNQTTIMLNRWSYEGMETNQPKAVYGDPMGNSRFSDRWIEDGSYLSLKSLSINYSIPLKSNVIEGINIWASANNLWTLTNYLGRDPEVSAQRAVLFQGIDPGLIPSTKSYFVGIKLNL